MRSTLIFLALLENGKENPPTRQGLFILSGPPKSLGKKGKTMEKGRNSLESEKKQGIPKKQGKEDQGAVSEGVFAANSAENLLKFAALPSPKNKITSHCIRKAWENSGECLRKFRRDFQPNFCNDPFTGLKVSSWHNCFPGLLESFETTKENAKKSGSHGLEQVVGVPPVPLEPLLQYACARAQETEKS